MAVCPGRRAAGADGGIRRPEVGDGDVAAHRSHRGTGDWRGCARQWQGICWYRKTFDLSPGARDQEVVLRFEGAMNVAEVWVNGQSAGKFMGGYLPYVMDISKLVRPGETNLVAVRLDNRDNPLTGPKPLADLDFNLYGGLYRGASLVLKNKLHITAVPSTADRTCRGRSVCDVPEAVVPGAGDGQCPYPGAGHDDAAARAFVVRTNLARCPRAGHWPPRNQPRSRWRLEQTGRVIQEIQVAEDPKLWSPQSPGLYQLRSELVEDGGVVDREQTRIGIRRIQITQDGFWINGEKMFLRGVNRHQEYPLRLAV